MKSHYIFVSIIIALTLQMSGCDKVQQVAQNVSTKSKMDNAELDKFNTYVHAHNGTIGMFYGGHQGSYALLDAYQAQNFEGKIKLETSEPLLYLNIFVIRNTVNDLKKAQAIKPTDKLKKLHMIGEKMISNAEPLLETATSLDAYIKSKKYLDDNFAKLKSENSKFIQLWSQFNEDENALSTEIAIVERVNMIEEVATERGAGNLRYAAKLEALMKANDILSSLSVEKNISDQMFKKTDLMVTELEKILNDLQSQKDSVEPDTRAKISYDNAYSSLNSFIGQYRTLKSTHKPYAYSMMVHYYNSALQG